MVWKFDSVFDWPWVVYRNIILPPVWKCVQVTIKDCPIGIIVGVEEGVAVSHGTIVLVVGGLLLGAGVINQLWPAEREIRQTKT